MRSGAASCATDTDPVTAALGDVHFIAALRCYARRILGDTALALRHQRAEDLVSRAAVIALGKTQAYDAAKGSVFGWLCGILHRLVGERQKKADRNRAKGDADRFIAELLSRETSPDASAALHSEWQRVQSALAELDPMDRRLVVEHHCNSRTARELAAETGLREGTVRVRISRSLTELRRHLIGEDAS